MDPEIDAGRLHGTDVYGAVEGVASRNGEREDVEERVREGVEMASLQTPSMDSARLVSTGTTKRTAHDFKYPDGITTSAPKIAISNSSLLAPTQLLATATRVQIEEGNSSDSHIGQVDEGDVNEAGEGDTEVVWLDGVAGSNRGNTDAEKTRDDDEEQEIVYCRAQTSPADALHFTTLLPGAIFQ